MHAKPMPGGFSVKCNAARAGINTRNDVLKMGIDKYNEECRSIVMRCACIAGRPYAEAPE